MTKPEPKEYIYKISPYVAGKSSISGANKIIKLSSNENPYGASPKALEAAKKSLEKLGRYPDSAHTELKNAIAKTYNLNAENIVCGAGSDELIGLLVHIFAGEGDEVIYTEHGFLMYKIYTLANGATPVVAAEKDYKTSVDEIFKKVTNKTRIVFVANPNNPTGSYIPKAEIKRLRDGLRDDIILAVDCAYTEYVEAKDYSGALDMIEKTNNTVVLRTFSKVYGLSALRLGWGYFPAHVAEALNRVRSPFNVSSTALAAGIAAIQDQDYIKEMVALNNSERARVAGVLTQLGLKVYPSECNFIMVDFADKCKAANEYLLQNGIIVREIDNYGLAGKLRISIGTADENNALLAVITNFLGN